MNFRFLAPFLSSISTVSGDALSWVNQNSGALGVAAAFITMLTTIIYTAVTYRILAANRDSVKASRDNIDALMKLEAERVRAQVVVDIEPSRTLKLRIRNLGATPARDVCVQFSPPLRKRETDPTEVASLTKQDILWLVPGDVLTEILGSWEQVKAANGGVRFNFTVEYTCHDGERISYGHSIDLSMMDDVLRGHEMHGFIQSIRHR
jgi:hypothetical protein